MKKLLLISLKLVIFVIAIALIVVNQKTNGIINLAWMLVGLGLLIGLLYSYNEKFK